MTYKRENTRNIKDKDKETTMRESTNNIHISINHTTTRTSRRRKEQSRKLTRTEKRTG